MILIILYHIHTVYLVTVLKFDTMSLMLSISVVLSQLHRKVITTLKDTAFSDYQLIRPVKVIAANGT